MFGSRLALRNTVLVVMGLGIVFSLAYIIFSENSVDAVIASVLGPLSDAMDSFVFHKFDVGGLEIPWIVVWMFAPMAFLTVYFGFINLKSFKLAGKILKGRFHDPSAPGEVSQFQALTTALSGTVGLGNIAGVAIAIATGGPGATFWMIIIGLCAMSLKFAECTLGVKYRVIHADGSVSGGPMYYLKLGLANRGYKRLGIVLASAYALIGVPTLIQWATVNQMFSQLNAVLPVFGDQKWGFGVLLAVLVGIVIIGGIKEIAKVTSKLVPLMVAIYLLSAFFVLATHIAEIPAAFLLIFEHAFNPGAVGGGVIGVIIIGMRRAVYSTEAGLGTSSMVHAAAKTREPVSEGIVGLMEPFIDTVVISTITALVIIVTGAWQLEGLRDVQLTSAAFATSISWFPWVLALAVFMFGYSTLISWGYYTGKIWEYVFGEDRLSVNMFKSVYCLLLIPGAVMTAQQVFNFIDSLFFLLAIPNIVGIYIMAPELKADVLSYLSRLKSGEIKETGPQAAPNMAE